jgi:cobyrinic acid a,c-diamide synthase
MSELGAGRGVFPAHAPGIVVAAPASGSGKTTITLGLLRAQRNSGLRVGSAKVGPDYIDPRFHAAASGAPCVNLDGWAMHPALLDGLAGQASTEAEFLIVEGVMGLFDGAARLGATSSGSTAELAARYGWPVLLVVDARAQAQSVAALVRGFRDHEPSITLAGVILNRVGGERHVRLLTSALEGIGVQVFGAVPRNAGLEIPSRHLGLVQAGEHPDLEAFIEHAADVVGNAVDLGAVARAAKARRGPASGAGTVVASSPGQCIAVAHDAAFGFIYPHLLDGWRTAGAEISLFSPLADEAPSPTADVVFLPGGYPELHAGVLAANNNFLEGLRRAASLGRGIHGECGGYMVLGEGLTDADGRNHRMAGLLDVETSFAKRSLSLGYRLAESLAETPFGAIGVRWRGHEFHYATVSRESGDEPLFKVMDAEGRDLGAAGLVRGTVSGSFMHLIDQVR